MSYHAHRTAAERGAPLVFTFHGTGGDQHQFHGVARRLVPGAAVVSPRGDVNEMGHLRFFKRRAEGVYDMDDLWMRVEAMAKFLRAEKSEAAPPRTIGLGYSNGANILAATAIRHPDIADDLVLMHPLVPFTPEPQPGLAGRRVLITAGERDPIGPATRTETLYDWFQEQGAEVTLHWHDGGHELREEELSAALGFLNRRAAPVGEGRPGS